MDTPNHHAGRRHWSGRRPRSFIASEALSRTWWQVKDSNLRSFRDGFTDHGRQARDQRKRPFHRQLTCVFPTDIRRQPTAAGHPTSHFYDDLVTVAMPDDRHSFFTATSFGAAIAPW